MTDVQSAIAGGEKVARSRTTGCDRPSPSASPARTAATIHRFAERTRDVGDARVDRDDDIERVDQRGGLQPVDVGGKTNDRVAQPAIRRSPVRAALFAANTSDARKLEQRRERGPGSNAADRSDDAARLPRRSTCPSRAATGVDAPRQRSARVSRIGAKVRRCLRNRRPPTSSSEPSDSSGSSSIARR